MPPGSAGSLRPPTLPPFRPAPAPRPPPSGTKPLPPSKVPTAAPLRRPLPPPRPKPDTQPAVSRPPDAAHADVTGAAVGRLDGSQQPLPDPEATMEKPDKARTASGQEGGAAPAPAADATAQPAQTELSAPPLDAWPGHRAADSGANAAAVSGGPPSPFAATQSGSDGAARGTFALDRAPSDRCGLAACLSCYRVCWL